MDRDSKRPTGFAPRLPQNLLTAGMLMAIAATALYAQPDALPPAMTRAGESAKYAEQEINLGVAPADPVRVAELIAELGHPQFERRTRATEELARLCPGAFGDLARAYREQDDYETRLRIQEIVREQYLWHTLLKHNGFLGVRFTPLGFDRTPGDTPVVLIEHVEPGTAAEEAGLRRGDRIRAIDGQPFGDDNSENAFRVQIQNKGAGAKVVLQVERRNVLLAVEVTLKARPIEQYTSPELLDELNLRMQAFTLWWDRHFSLPTPRAERTPSTNVLELPD